MKLVMFFATGTFGVHHKLTKNVYKVFNVT